MSAIHALFLWNYCPPIIYTYIELWRYCSPMLAIISTSHNGLGLIDFYISYLGLIDLFQWQAIFKWEMFKWYLFKCLYRRHKNLSAFLIDLCLSALKCFYVIISPFALVDGWYKKYIEWTNWSCSWPNWLVKEKYLSAFYLSAFIKQLLLFQWYYKTAPQANWNLTHACCTSYNVHDNMGLCRVSLTPATLPHFVSKWLNHDPSITFM